MQKLNRRLEHRGEGGFTLIELLVVIAILAILAGVVVFAVGNSTQNARVQACKTERSAIITAVVAANTSNEVANNGEAWDDYLKGDPSDIEYFSGLTAGTQPTSVARNTTGDSASKVTTTECKAISATDLGA